MNERMAPPESDPIPTSVGALDIAMAAEAHAPAPDSPARVLLAEQTRLVREQVALARNERLRNRIKAARDVTLTGAVLLMAAAFGGLVWDASRDSSLVIQAFSVPPDMAERGLTGEVLGGQLLDRIAAIDARAQSFRAPETFRNDWGGDIQVEIPQTGVSLGDMDRYLRNTLGDRTTIAGEVFREPAALALTVRVGTSGAVTARGADAELGAMLQRAAESVFARTQPFRHSKYLEFSGRRDEAMTVARSLARSGPPEERPWAWAQISNLLFYEADYPGAVEAGRTAVRLDPEQGLGWLNLRNAALPLGWEEEAYRSLRKAVELLRRGKGGFSAAAVAVGSQNEANLRAALRDYGGAIAVSTRFQAVDYPHVDPVETKLSRALHLIGLHEVSASRSIANNLEDRVTPGHGGDLLSPQYLSAAALEDWPAAAAALERAMAASQARGRAGAVARERFLRPRLAHAYAETGRGPEARALLQPNPRDCYRCLWLEGRTLAALGAAGGADRAFMAAARQAPSLPVAYQEWGEAKLARGDLEGAIRLLREAQKRGPRWADPLKFEGDALARQGEHRAAVRRYREAAERAPRWGALHLAWGRSLEALGRKSQARERYQAAFRLDLSAADRAALRRALASG